MTEKVKSFRKGDWVSHLHHGVGQVEGKEKKVLDGESQDYYKVQTRNGVYWIPTDNIDPERIRPVVSEKKLQKALEIMELPAEPMDGKHTVRKNRINEVLTKSDILELCTLLRDLHARRAGGKLNTTEQRAHTNIKKIISAEWAATRETTPQEANKELNKILRRIKPPEKKKRK
jgi:RNA polymerase-interacting CarD/CdnL/TRCF family regulator